MTMDEACTLVYDHCPDQYARSYADAWLTRLVHARCVDYGIPVEANGQAAYILANLSRWRGPMATEVRAVLKRIAAERNVIYPNPGYDSAYIPRDTPA